MTLHLSRTVFIKNLNLATNEADLRYNFGKCGKIDKIEIVHDAAYRSKGFAYVSYARPQDAEWAVENLDGTMMDGRRIHVEFNRQKLRARREEKGFKIDILTKKLQEVEGYKTKSDNFDNGDEPSDDRSSNRRGRRYSNSRGRYSDSYSSSYSRSPSPSRYRRRRRPYESWGRREETEFKIDILKKKVEEAQINKKIYQLQGEKERNPPKENQNQHENSNSVYYMPPPQIPNKDSKDSSEYSYSSYSSSSSSSNSDYSSSYYSGSSYYSSSSSSSSPSPKPKSKSKSKAESKPKQESKPKPESKTKSKSKSSDSYSSSYYSDSNYESSYSYSSDDYYYSTDAYSYYSRSPSPPPKKKKSKKTE